MGADNSDAMARSDAHTPDGSIDILKKPDGSIDNYKMDDLSADPKSEMGTTVDEHEEEEVPASDYLSGWKLHVLTIA